MTKTIEESIANKGITPITNVKKTLYKGMYPWVEPLKPKIDKNIKIIKNENKNNQFYFVIYQLNKIHKVNLWVLLLVLKSHL